MLLFGNAEWPRGIMQNLPIFMLREGDDSSKTNELVALNSAPKAH